MTPTAILAVNGSLPVTPFPRVAEPLSRVDTTLIPGRDGVLLARVATPFPPEAVQPTQFGATITYEPVAQRTHSGIANANALSVSFYLPANHIDKCGKAYRKETLSEDTPYSTPKWTTVPTRRQQPPTTTAIPSPNLTTNNPFALLQDDDDDADEPTDSPTTAAALAARDDNVDNATNGASTAVAFSVLKQETGKFLEH